MDQKRADASDLEFSCSKKKNQKKNRGFSILHVSHTCPYYPGELEAKKIKPRKNSEKVHQRKQSQTSSDKKTKPKVEKKNVSETKTR